MISLYSRALTLTLLALTLAACGGAQQNSTPAGLSSAFGAVPADVTYAFGIDLGAMPDDAVLDMRNSATEYATVLTSNPYSSQDDELGALLLSAIANPTANGLPADGQFAVFSDAALPVFVIELDDETLFRDLFNSFARLAEFEQSGSVEIGGREFESYTQHELKLDVSIADGYAILRSRADDMPRGALSDAALARVLAGGGDGWVSSPSHRSLVNEVSGSPRSVAFATLRTAALAQTFVDIAQGNVGALGSGVLMGYDSAEQQQLCEDTAEAFVTSFPGLSMLTYATDDGTYGARGRLEMSRAASERMQAAFQPVLTPASEATAALPIFFSSGLDIMALLDAIVAEPAAAECPDVAAIPGQLARGREEVRNSAEASLALGLLPGALTVAIEGLDFGGLVPDAAIAVAIGSANASGLAVFVERQLRGSGLSASVDETATVPTVEFSTFGFSLRMMQFEDRVVLTTGELSSDLVASVSLPQNGASTATMVMSSHYPSLLEVVTSLLGWVEGMGGDASLSQLLRSQTTSLERWQDNHTTIELDARGVVMHAITRPR